MTVEERKIQFDDQELLSLLTFKDSYLQLIESRFQSTILIRGNSIIIKGTNDELRIIEELFNELSYMHKKNKSISEFDISTTIALITASKDKKIHDIKKADNVIYHGVRDLIRARTTKQMEYYKKVLKNDLVFSIGPAGTGKTFLAVAMALAALRRNEVSRIVLSRPAVEAGESLGFLPGDLNEKLDPYMRPLTDAMFYMLSPEKLKNLQEKEVIEITPLAYMRGRTLNNAFIILDEAQNATITQMKMFLTRMGANSKAIVTGDVTQIDLKNRQDSGLIDAQRILKNINGIDFVYFSNNDVVRHKLVADIIQAYEKDGQIEK